MPSLASSHREVLHQDIGVRRHSTLGFHFYLTEFGVVPQATGTLTRIVQTRSLGW